MRASKAPLVSVFKRFQDFKGNRESGRTGVESAGWRIRPTEIKRTSRWHLYTYIRRLLVWQIFSFFLPFLPPYVSRDSPGQPITVSCASYLRSLCVFHVKSASLIALAQRSVQLISSRTITTGFRRLLERREKKGKEKKNIYIYM